MHPGLHARSEPDKPAVVMAGSGEVVSYGELDARSNQLAHLFRARGLHRGDHVALCMENNSHYHEVLWGAWRAGLYYTAISSRLTPAELAYIVDDCEAKALVVSAATAGQAVDVLGGLPGVTTKLVIGGDVDGFERYETAVAPMPATPIADESAGQRMLYSSGTTGRPKGVKAPLPPLGDLDVEDAATAGLRRTYDAGPDTVYLSPAPLYHSAPLAFTMGIHRVGGTVIVMERFDPIEFLRLIEEHRVTHTQVVPTMFVRLLKLPEADRRGHDLSSLRCVIHAAAPCPVPVKEQMIDWFGPILQEYYAGTEGNGSTAIDSHEWLAHKGSVGRPRVGAVHICDPDGAELPPGEQGTIWFEGPTALSFEYHNDPDKTASSRHPKGWSTLGDIGYLDEDGWLYLTDRKANMIISGGVNIYPQEAETVLTMHPKVMDVAGCGVPTDDLGEEVKAVVQPVDMAAAGPDLERELIEYCRERLAHFKCPRSVDFEAELPRHPTGKLYKRLLRDRYWAGHASKLV